MNIYDNIPKNEMTIKYKNYLFLSSKERLPLFGRKFVNNNYHNCYIIIEGKKYNISVYCPISFKQDFLEVRLIEKRKIFDMSDIFNASNLYSVDISKWNTTDVINLSNMFYSCNYLEKLPDILNWDTKLVKNIENIFSSC